MECEEIVFPDVAPPLLSLPPGVEKLIRAILVLSLEDTLSSGPYRDVTLNWIYSDDTEYLFSFLNICQMLTLDPGKIRAAVGSPLS